MELLEREQDEPFLQDVITMDETWLPFNNPKPQNAWLPPNARALPTPVSDFRQKKIMLSVFWGPQGVVHWELADGTINKEVYCAQLDRVAEVLEDSGRVEPVIFCMTTPLRIPPRRSCVIWVGMFFRIRRIRQTLLRPTSICSDHSSIGSEAKGSAASSK
jgi:hypothetical protein